VRSLVAILLCVAAASAAGCSSDSKDRVVRDHDIVFYERGGGRAGTTVSLSVGPNGKATISPPGTEVKLRPAAVRRLRRAIARARIDRLPKVSRPSKRIPDGYQYTISAGGETVQAEDGAVPARLKPLRGELERLLAAGGTR
jgi:hypothetical protein